LSRRLLSRPVIAPAPVVELVLPEPYVLREPDDPVVSVLLAPERVVPDVLLLS
jgi:hypothetical protein